jgi:hypothetical protein
VLLGFVVPERSDDYLKRKTAVDNGLQTIGCYRPDHTLLISFALDDEAMACAASCQREQAVDMNLTAVAA